MADLFPFITGIQPDGLIRKLLPNLAAQLADLLAVAGEKRITVSVTYADGTAEHFEVSTRADCLKEAAEAVLTLEGEETAHGFTVYAVNGAEADFRKGEAYWAIYADGAYAQSSADRLPVFDGGSYAFVYERL